MSSDPRPRRIALAALLALVGLCVVAPSAGAFVFKTWRTQPPASAPVGASITYSGMLLDDSGVDDLNLSYSVQNRVGFVSTALGGDQVLQTHGYADFTGFGVINGAPGTNATGTVTILGVPDDGTGATQTFTLPFSIAVTEGVTAKLTADKTSATVLDRITYTLELKNHSDSVANLSAVNLAAPAGTTSVSYTPGETSLTGGGATTTFTRVVDIDDSLASGATVTQPASASYSMPGVGLPARPVDVAQEPATTTIENSGIRRLAASITGAGKGEVTGPGIDCPGDCEQWHARDSLVELSAQPAPGSVFAGWQGDCNGTGPCDVLMSGERGVVARFEPAPSGGTPPEAGGTPPETVGTPPEIKDTPPEAKDTVAPETTIAKAPKKRSAKRKARFTLTASEAATFECQLDFDAYEPCAHMFKRKVGVGKHRLLVRATDAAGNVDQTAAEHRWRVTAG